MNGWASEILDVIDTSYDNKNIKGLIICTVKTVNPLILTYQGVDIGTKEGDKIYIHPLFTLPVINQDENTLVESQNFTSSTAYNSPEFSAVVQGTIPDFIKEFYLFYKNWCSLFVLNAGDMVAVWELKANNYLVLQKISIDKIQTEEKGEENNEL